MAHFAEIDENNVVLRVVVISDEDTSVDGVEDEAVGIAFCKKLWGEETSWLKCSYNTALGVHALGGTPFRKNYPSAGFTYNADMDAFITPKPYNSWVFNEETGAYDPPSAIPSDAGERDTEGFLIAYKWDEASLAWVRITHG